MEVRALRLSRHSAMYVASAAVFLSLVEVVNRGSNPSCATNVLQRGFGSRGFLLGPALGPVSCRVSEPSSLPTPCPVIKVGND